MKTEATDLFEADATNIMRGNSGVHTNFIDMFAPCAVGDTTWNTKLDPFDKVVQEGLTWRQFSRSATTPLCCSV